MPESATVTGERELSTSTRVLVSASAPLVAWLLGRVPLPFSTEGLEDPYTLGSTLTATALGVQPLIVASGLVELWSLVGAARRRVRAAGPAAFAQRLRSTVILGFVIAAFQAYGMATALVSLGRLGDVDVDPRLLMASLLGGYALTCIAALGLSRWGLVNGALALLAGAGLVDLAQAVPLVVASHLGALAPLVAAAGATALAAVATLVALAPAPPAPPAPTAGGYRDRGHRPVDRTVTLPPVPAGVTPLEVGSGAVQLAVMLGGLGALERVATPPWVSIPLVVAVSIALGFAFARPGFVARLWSRASGGEVPEARLVAEARRACHAAIVRGALLVAVLGVATLALAHPWITLGVVALATAVVADGIAAVRARRDGTRWVAAWPEPRPVAVPAALEALRRAGIRATVSDRLATSLFPLVGPVAPTWILVPQDDLARAGEVLGAVLPDDATGTFSRDGDATSDSGDGSGVVAGDAPGWSLSGRVVVGVLAVALVGAIGLGELARTPSALDGAASFDGGADVGDGARSRRASLQVTHVLDDPDALAPLVASPFTLPAGARVEHENVHRGEDMGVASYVVFERVDGETLDATLARARSWSQDVATSPGEVIGFGRVEQIDDATGDLVPIGYRTYVLEGTPILTEADVAHAEARLSPGDVGQPVVAVELTPEAAGRFEQETARAVRHRLAIVVDGVVMSAPLVMSPIPGGRIQIAMGSASADPSAEARRLAAGLARR